MATAPVLLRPRNFQWYWISTTNSQSISDDDGWQKYIDVDNEIIEDAFNEKKDKAEIDGGYVIDLKLMSQYNKLNGSNPRPIKRVQLQTNRNNGHIREERFSLPVAVSPISSTSVSSRNDELQEWRYMSDCGSTYLYFELTEKNKNIAYVVEDAAQGIIKEGETQGKIQEASWLAQQLRNVKASGESEIVMEWQCFQLEIPSIIGQTCVNLYTRESFWYRSLNQFMRNPDNITRERVNIFGPFCFLLKTYLRQNETYTIPTVFRAVDLTREQLLVLQNDVKFISFTSTTKSRELAEFYDRNTLLIIDLNIKKRDGLDVGRSGAHISHLSNYPAEEEFLIWPDTSFHFIRYEDDKEKRKHILYLKSYQTNC
jgi:hypothetical protein